VAADLWDLYCQAMSSPAVAPADLIQYCFVALPPPFQGKHLTALADIGGPSTRHPRRPPHDFVRAGKITETCWPISHCCPSQKSFV